MDLQGFKGFDKGVSQNLDSIGRRALRKLSSRPDFWGSLILSDVRRLGQRLCFFGENFLDQRLQFIDTLL